ncbi:hypothetical protein T484DRAFT_1960350 [Baffinella frigidus]|nr:hypothetical protein T484DRAFT_1960350 [Cryptophyta sp. CCMP2293]
MRSSLSDWLSASKRRTFSLSCEIWARRLEICPAVSRTASCTRPAFLLSSFARAASSAALSSPSASMDLRADARRAWPSATWSWRPRTRTSWSAACCTTMPRAPDNAPSDSSRLLCASRRPASHRPAASRACGGNRRALARCSRVNTCGITLVRAAARSRSSSAESLACSAAARLRWVPARSKSALASCLFAPSSCLATSSACACALRVEDLRLMPEEVWNTEGVSAPCLASTRASCSSDTSTTAPSPIPP